LYEISVPVVDLTPYAHINPVDSISCHGVKTDSPVGAEISLLATGDSAVAAAPSDIGNTNSDVPINDNNEISPMSRILENILDVFMRDTSSPQSS
jgi:hypothetical protein